MGNTQANFYLGLLYDFWYGYPELDYGKARVYYEASGEHPCAQLALGFLYYNGYGVEQDLSKAREWYEQSAAAKAGQDS